MAKSGLVLLAPYGEPVWRAQCAALSDISETQIVDLTEDQALSAMARRTLAEAPQKFSVAGHCLGGYVIFELLRQAPERLERIALINTHARADTPSEAARRRERWGALQDKAHLQNPPEDYIENVLLWMLSPAALKISHIRHAASVALAGVSPSASARQQNAMLNRPDSRQDLARVTAPTLIVGGLLDRIAPAALSEEMAALVPPARIHVLDGCGHLAPIEAADAVTALMRGWLSA